MESDALIGSTGFVGGNLLLQREFGSAYNSSNVGEIRGKKFRTVICAAPGAEKWKANRDPDSDEASVNRLWDSLQSLEADKVILISTVDVYPNPVDVFEETPIDPAECTAYGRHRLELEQKVAEAFNALIVRLPGLFGPGLKKNALFDLLNDHLVYAIDSRAVYQFYDVRRLANDLGRFEAAELSLVNVATEPIAIDSIAHAIFGRTLSPRTEGTAPRYDFRSRHASLLGGENGYLQSAEAVLAEMRDWVASESAPKE
jgi:nucleoside-diphosphate-sugar epimerase